MENKVQHKKKKKKKTNCVFGSLLSLNHDEVQFCFCFFYLNVEVIFEHPDHFCFYMN